MESDPADTGSPTNGVAQDSDVYETRPLKSKATIRWRISDIAMIIDDKSWPSLSLSFEVRGSLGRNYTWRVSLESDEDYLYGRAELVSPIKYRIPYHMEFKLVNMEGVQHEEDSVPREITSQDDPQKWKICQAKYLTALKDASESASSGVLELVVHVQCFGSETSQGYQLQNYPY